MYIRGPRGELKRSRRWGKEVLPPDFSMMDFSDLEEGARKLYHMKDDRMYSDELTPAAAGDSIMVTGQGQSVAKWRAEYDPIIAGRITPSAKNLPSREADKNIPIKDAYFNAFDHLAEGDLTKNNWHYGLCKGRSADRTVAPVTKRMRCRHADQQ